MQAFDQVKSRLKWAGYLSILLVPALGPIGYSVGIAWLSPLVIFVAIPVLDWVVGKDPTNMVCVPNRSPAWKAYYRSVPYAYLLGWAASLAWSAHMVSHADLTWSQWGGIAVASGLSAAFATCVAHELLHRATGLDRGVTRIVMAACGYGQFVFDHIHHHRTVGHFESGTVPFKGETIYAFVTRNMRLSFVNTFGLEEQRRLRRGHPWWRNRVLQQHALTACLALAFLAIWGWAGLALFAVQAMVAMANLEIIQYFEHYGLIRPEGEAMSKNDSWNCEGWVTNALTLNITRHAHHHGDSSVPYQDLCMLSQAPTMPVGYFGLFWLALVPAVWRRCIDPKVPATVSVRQARG